MTAHDAGGTITFTVTTNQSVLAPDAEIEVYVDSDRNEATALRIRGLGADHFFSYRGGLGLPLLGHISGNSLIIDFNSSLSLFYGGGVLTARVNREDLGGTERFFFLIESEQDADGEVIAADFAPDGSPPYEYSFVEAPLTLKLAKPTGNPVKPVAGKRFSVVARVDRSDGQPFTSATVLCGMKVGSKSIVASGRVAAGSARCSARILKDAKGKTLRGTIAVSSTDAAAVKRAVAFKIG